MVFTELRVFLTHSLDKICTCSCMKLSGGGRKENEKRPQDIGIAYGKLRQILGNIGKKSKEQQVGFFPTLKGSLNLAFLNDPF